jgi:hypothetical protein
VTLRLRSNSRKGARKSRAVCLFGGRHPAIKSHSPFGAVGPVQTDSCLMINAGQTAGLLGLLTFSLELVA